MYLIREVEEKRVCWWRRCSEKECICSSVVWVECEIWV